MTRRLELACIAALGAGAVFGAAIQFGGKSGLGPHWLFHLGGPWLAVAFLAGLLARRPASGALLGALSIAGATGGYYTADVWLSGPGTVTTRGR